MLSDSNGKESNDIAERYMREVFKKRLDIYISSGRVHLVQFPFFSEIQYRRDITTIKLALTYDQNIAYEYCMMLSRQNNDRWLLFLDTDEYIRVGGMNAKANERTSDFSLARAVDMYTKSHGKDLYGDKIITEIYLNRYDYMTAQKQSQDVADHTMLLAPAQQSIFRHYQYRSVTAQIKGRSILDPLFGQVMFMHAQVNYQGGNSIFARTTTLWPFNNNTDLKHNDGINVIDDASISLEIAHFTCLQTNRFPMNVQQCFCPEEESDIATCKLDSGLVDRFANDIEKFLVPAQ